MNAEPEPVVEAKGTRTSGARLEGVPKEDTGRQRGMLVS